MTDKFIELADAKAVADFEEALGRAYAAKIGSAYPMPPDRYIPGNQPAPGPAFYQRFYVRADVIEKGGGVIAIDAVADTLQGAKVTLTDGTKPTVDVRTAAKDEAQLSADAKAALAAKLVAVDAKAALDAQAVTK